MIKIEKRVINFQLRKDQKLSGTLIISNIHETESLSFNISVTTPDSYIVNPKRESLAPMETITISIDVQPGYKLHNLLRDKFVVTTHEIRSKKLSEMELSDLWSPEKISVDKSKLYNDYDIECNFPEAAIRRLEEKRRKESPIPLLHQLVERNIRIDNKFQLFVILQLIALAAILIPNMDKIIDIVFCAYTTYIL